MIFFRKCKRLFLPAFLLFLLLAAAILLLHTLIEKQSVQAYLLKEISSSTGYALHSGRIDLALWRGLGLSVHDLSMRSPDGSGKMTVARLDLKLQVKELLKGRFVPSEIQLAAPRIQWSNPAGAETAATPSAPFFDKKLLQNLAGMPPVRLENASVCVQGFPVELENLSAEINPAEKTADPFRATLKGTAVWNGNEIPFTARIGVACKPGRDAFINVDMKTADLPLSFFTWPGTVPVEGGTMKMAITAQGNPTKSMTAQGQLFFKNPDFLIVDGPDRKRFLFDALRLPFSASYVDRKLSIPSFQLLGKGFLLKGDAALNLKDRSNPRLDLKVVSDEMTLQSFRKIFPSSLLPSWVENRLFPLFSGGTVRVDHFALNGTFDEIARLDHVSNAGALLLRLDCKKLTAFQESEGLPVKDVFGELEIKKGAVNVSGVTAFFGQSRISEGTLHVNSLYADDPKFLITTAGSFDIADLLAQKKLPLLPKDVRQKLDDFGDGFGKLEANITLSYEDNWDFPEIRDGTFTFSHCRVEHAKILFPATLDHGALTVDSNGRKTFSASGSWGRSRMTASGTIGKTWKTIQAGIQSEMDMNEWLERFFPDVSPAMQFKTHVPCAISLKKGQEDWTLEGTVDLKKVSLETDSLSVAPFKDQGQTVFHALWKPGREFRISDLACDMGESRFRLNGLMDFTKDDAIAFRARSSNVVLEDLGIRFKKRNLLAAGNLGFDVSVNVFPSKPMETTVQGVLTGHGLSFETTAFPLPVSNCSLEVAFLEKEVSLKKAHLQMGKTDFRINGNLHGWDGLRGNLDVKTDSLFLADVIPGGLSGLKGLFSGQPGRTTPATETGDGQGEVASRPVLTISAKESNPPVFRKSEEQATGFRSSPLSPPVLGLKATEDGKQKKPTSLFIKRSDIQFDVNALKGELEQFTCGPVKIECALRAGDFYLTRSRFDWKNGSLRLRGHRKTNEQAATMFSGYLEMKRQPLRELPESFRFIQSGMEGDMTMEALFFAEGNNRTQLVSSLTGSVNFDLERGMLKNSHVFIKIMDFLSLQRVFQERPSNFTHEGLYFESLGGNVGLEKGIARTDGLSMQSPVFNALLKGEADFNTNRLHAELGILPLVTIDTMISSLPIVGYLLTGDDKALYADYFEVQGPISSPEVDYIPLKSISNGTFGLIKRMFLTPHRLFKSISDAAGEFEEKGVPLPDDDFRPENDMGA